MDPGDVHEALAKKCWVEKMFFVFFLGGDLVIRVWGILVVVCFCSSLFLSFMRLFWELVDLYV